MAAGAVRLGDMLVKATLITREQLNQALQQQQTAGGRIGTKSRQARLHQRGRHYLVPEPAVRRPVHQSVPF